MLEKLNVNYSDVPLGSCFENKISILPRAFPQKTLYVVPTAFEGSEGRSALRSGLGSHTARNLSQTCAETSVPREVPRTSMKPRQF